MKKENKIVILGISYLLAGLFIFSACGNSSSNTTKDDNQDSIQNETDVGSSGTDTLTGDGSQGDDIGMTGSNIPYLRANHANYSEHGSAQTPVSVKDANAKSINWTITAGTEVAAVKLQEHLKFMEERLQNDKNPRGWDKLFLMEAYMKYNKYYTTTVERSGTTIVVSKNASTACAYEVISAHADAVSGDFFARGNIMIDYSAKAESILSSSACNDVRTSVERYIVSRQRSRGMR